MFEPAIGGGGMGTARALLSVTTHSIAKLTAERRFSLYTQSVIAGFFRCFFAARPKTPDALFAPEGQFFPLCPCQCAP
ncbi:hypothetical protein [Photorhabdus khanii]|uniref:hypothetical protein n=1 Tax=Photorhabdus khanii TaxID=1004150 RepID=UPI0013969B83|nr:hypothetical protein [Photorhabdus khanii]